MSPLDNLRKMKTSLQLFVAFILVISPVNLYPQSTDNKIEQVEKLISRWKSDSEPGFALAIIKDGRIIHKQGYGLANLEKRTPITPKTVFRIGSTSKQFTAACITLLEQRGELSLDDKIRKYFPEFPSYYEPVTIRHMLHHTAGVKDFFTIYHKAGKSDFFYFTTADVVKLLKDQTSLYFPPGERYVYINSNYVLLGEIVRKVSGQPLRQFAHENFFVPLGMKNTHYHDDQDMYVVDRARGYRIYADGYRLMETPLEVVGDGGIFTTVEDLFLWDQAFYNDRFENGLFTRMTEKGRLNDGTEISYAFGLFVEEYLGTTMISHGGTCLGHRADIIRFPEEKFTVIMLTNRRRIDPTTYCKQIAEIYLKK